MSDVKSSMRGITMNPALESLARTDDILALIGVVILSGVVISAYGAYWQGKIAKAAYKKDFEKGDTTKDNTRLAVLGGGVALLVIIVVLFLIMRNNAKPAVAK